MMRLPNILTMSRIAIIPVLVALLWIREPETQWAATLLYALACLTDWLDGYFARSLNQQSSVGRLFDPIADKLLVGACLLVLCAFGGIDGWSVLAAVIILLREILVSGLREYLAEFRLRLPVSRLAKWKTALQMIALGLLMLGDAGPAFLPTVEAGEVCLWAAALLTLWTGYDYLRSGVLHANAPDAVAPDERHAAGATPRRDRGPVRSGG